MKKFIAFVAIAALAFSACNGSYTIAKRKYNKGFYVSKSGSNSTKPTETKISPVKTTLPEEKIETVIVAKAPEQKAEPVEIAAVRPMAQPAMESGHKAKPQHQPVASTAKKDYAPKAEIKPVNIDAAKASSKAKKGDTNIVLLVILSLFPILCLIAVYLHDGGVTLNFWIDLLLHLTFIGEIIFALLVVLDVVDLS